MAPTIKETRPVPLSDLHEHPENDRIGDVDRVARSLLVNAQYRPIVVQAGTGLVLAGNHVRRACALLASGELPPLPEGYDDETHEDYSPVLVRAVETFEAAGFADEVMATLVECDDDEARAILAADNHTADDATYNIAASLDLARALEQAGQLAAATWMTGDLDDMAAALEEAAAKAAREAGQVPGISDRGKDVGDYAEGYEASGTRSIVIFLGAPEYIEMQDRLGRLCKAMGVDSNTEVIVRLVRDADPGAPAEEATTDAG